MENNERIKRKSIAKIKVIGVGGGGNNAVNRMIDFGITSAEFIAVNTDLQDLDHSKAPIRIQLGEIVTCGLGAGADPEMGKRAAEESKEELKEILKGTDLLFITAGMGGGTGTGAAPIIAKLAKDMGILTIAVVTKPFATFEGKRRMDNALKGVDEIKNFVDILIVIPNDKIKTFAPRGTPLVKCFAIVDDILRQGIQGITDIITDPSLINLDFADIRTIIKNKGNAHIGIGMGKGENATMNAIRQAVLSPLLETNIEGATSCMMHIVGSETISLNEIEEASALVQQVIDKDAQIIVGTGVDPNLNDEVKVTIIAAGFNDKPTYAKNLNPYMKQNRSSIFNEEDNIRDLTKTYGLDSFVEKKEVVVPEKPIKVESIPDDRRYEEKRMEEPSKKSNIPPFLQRLQEKFKK